MYIYIFLCVCICTFFSDHIILYTNISIPDPPYIWSKLHNIVLATYLTWLWEPFSRHSTCSVAKATITLERAGQVARGRGTSLAKWEKLPAWKDPFSTTARCCRKKRIKIKEKRRKWQRKENTVGLDIWYLFSDVYIIYISFRLKENKYSEEWADK